MKLRPRMHFSPEKNWMNDPNGLIKFRGEYHLFFQHNPYGIGWGNMSWGHATSIDLINWDEKDIALKIDYDHESVGVFSGSAIEKDDVMHIFYTACSEENGSFVQTTCHAESSDGRIFKKDSEVLMQADGADCFSDNYRDPKVFKSYEKYFMVTGSAHKGEGRAIMYTSDDMKVWEKHCILEKNGVGTIWECPDVIKVNERSYLMISAIGAEKDGMEGLALVAPLNLKSGLGESPLGEFEVMDHGLDIYAVQSFSGLEDRTIVMGWLRMDGPLTKGNEWTGMQTMPREVFLVDGKLAYRPVKEIMSLSYKSKKCKSSASLELEGFHIIKRMVDSNLDEKIVLGYSEDEMLIISYCSIDMVVTVDRSTAVSGVDWLSGKPAILRTDKIKSREIELEIFIDGYVVEIFIDGGKQVITTYVSPANGYDSHIEISSECGFTLDTLID